MTHIVRIFTVGLLALTGLVATGRAADPPAPRPVVDEAIPAYAAKGSVTGAVAIAGSDTMQPIVAKLASAFRQWQPNVKVAVQGGGSDAALGAFLQGLAGSRRGDGNVRGHLSSNDVALLASSRPLSEGERKDFRSRYGFEVTEIPIAMDAIALYVHRSNPIEGVTLEQLDAMFGRDRKRGAGRDIVTWGQAGLKNEWEEQPLHLVGQDLRSGTRTFFKQTVLRDGEFKGTIKEEIGYATEILTISRDPLAIGYAGIGFQSTYVRTLPIAGRAGAPFVMPSAESSADGTYPLNRQLYLYAKRDPRTGLEPAIREFLIFINSREGQALVARAGAYPLPASQVQKNIHVLTGGPQAASLTTREAS
ncbi:MAG: PstS family phosphate ABC transporter substrate-binding protein [Nitrospira sp.]|nr:PstS family phosphate ABC transporter substrate-binding protein [Nitrospira sp.]